jgi:preprotein translocase subunit SecE
MEQDKRDKEKEKKKVAPKPKRERANFGEYMRGVKTEIKKVVWPTRKEMGSFTIVVLLACTFFAVLFAAFDSAFLATLKAVLGISLG